MKKILVATDGSEPAQAALRWSAQLVWIVGAKAAVMTVVEPFGPESETGHRVGEVASLLEEEWTAPFRGRGIDYELAVLEGDPRVCILDRVRGSDIDLVVVGATGGGGFPGLALGGVAHYLARHLPCPLVMVPRPGGPFGGGTLVVGADGSAANMPALRWTVETARQLGSGITAVFAHSPLADVMTHTAPNWRYPGEEHVRDALAPVGGDGLVPEILVAIGNPVQELARVAAERDAAMVVTGRRGWGGVHGLMLGRVPAQLLLHANRPVAIVPH